MLKVTFFVRDWGSDLIEVTHDTLFVDGANHGKIQSAATHWKNYWAITNNKDPDDFTVDYDVIKI